MLNLETRRQWFTALSTTGQLAIDGYPECFTLEPVTATDGRKPRAIPEGTFKLRIRWSHKFQKHVPHVENVPGFEAIEIHIGNVPKNTEACTLVGQTRGPAPDFIGRSAVAFTLLLAKLYAGAELLNPDDDEKDHIWDVGWITYVNQKLQ